MGIKHNDGCRPRASAEVANDRGSCNVKRKLFRHWHVRCIALIWILARLLLKYTCTMRRVVGSLLYRVSMKSDKITGRVECGFYY